MPSVEATDQNGAADANVATNNAGTSPNDSIRSRFSVNSTEDSKDGCTDDSTAPSVMSVGSDGAMNPRRSFNRTPDSKKADKTDTVGKSDVTEKTISRYTVNTSRLTVHSDRPAPWGPSLSQWDTTTSTTVDVPLVPVMQSTQVSGNTSDGISSLPSDYLHDSENYGAPSNGSSNDPSTPGSDPSSNPSEPLSSRDDSTLHTEIGPHPRMDVTERLLENSEVIYNERQGVSQLSKLPSTQWISGHLSCVYRSAAHKLMTVIIRIIFKRIKLFNFSSNILPCFW